MVTAALLQEPEGFERRTVECLRCGHSEQNILSLGLTRSLAVVWRNETPAAGNNADRH